MTSSPEQFPSDLEMGTFCRDSELAHLVGHVTRSLCPREDKVETSSSEQGNSLVLLRGGSGMGKSRLFERTQEAARELGIRVRETFCFERQGIPFLPILRLVKELIGESRDRQELWHRYAHVLTRVFPELAEDLGGEEPPIELPSEDGKIQFFDALTSILSELSHEQPLLLVVHDLHRSDRGTVEFIEYVARNAHLEVIGRHSGSAPLEETDERRGWREIRSREGRDGEYLGEGLPGEAEGRLSFGCRWMVLANYRGAAGLTGSIVGVSQAIDALATEPFAERIDLEPLGELEIEAITRRLLGERLSSDSTKRLVALTGGNPLHVVEVCRAIGEGSDAEQILDRLEAIPDTTTSIEQAVGKERSEKHESHLVDSTGAKLFPTLERQEAGIAALLRSRLGHLSDGCRQLTDVLAVLRRPTPNSSLEAILGRDPTSLAEDLSTLRAVRFVKTVDTGGIERSFLTHEDYVRWIYDSLEDAHRRRLHGQVGRFLSEQPRAHEPVRAFEIYEHLRSSDDPRSALPFGVAAARYFARGYAGELAVAILRELFPLIESKEDAPQKLELLLELSRLEADHGEISIAKTHVKQYLEVTDLTADQRVNAALHLADLYRRLDEPLKGLKVLNRLPRDAVSEAGGLFEARISEMRARLRLLRQDPKRAISLCLRGLKDLEGLENAESTAVREQRASLQEVLADSHRARGDMVSAIHGYHILLEQVEEVGDDVQLARVLRILGGVYYDRGNHFRAARYLFRALEGITRTQDISALAITYGLLGKVYRNSGDFLRSLDHFRRCLHLRERIGDKEGLSPTLNSIGSLYGHNGDYERAIRYFKRSVSNSERYGSTVGIVRAFLHLGWVYYDLGERKQVESLAKQILILAQEFNLSDLEGEGHRLLGNLNFLRGAWKEADREFRRALEIAQRRGLGKLEAASHLDLGMLLVEREEIDGALKRIAKGLLLAEEMQAIPLQVRGHMLKGGIARQLKGGTPERALESYRRGLELVAGGTLLPLQFELESAMARTHQSNLEFEPARECYARAERILQEISEGLSEDMRVVYHDDRRRKNFLDDLQRFQKEASGRPSVTPAMLPEPTSRGPARALPAPEEEGDAVIASVLSALDGLASAKSVEEWADLLLAESRRLVPAPRGFLWESSRSGGLPLAQSDMGLEEEWAASDRLAFKLVERAIEENRPLSSSESGWDELVSSLVSEGPVRSRSLVILPIDRPGTFCGALFLERPSAGNVFTESEINLLGQLLSLSRGQLDALARVREVRCFAGTTILTPAGFDLELDSFLEVFAEHRTLGVLEIVIPGFDLLLRTRDSDQLEREFLSCFGSEQCVAVRLGGDRYVIVIAGIDLETLRARRESLAAVLTELRRRQGLPEQAEVSIRVSAHSLSDREEVEQLRNLGSQVFQARSFVLDSEISELTAKGFTLKEAKATLERRFITSELFKSGGNITKAAASLGVHRPQLSTLIKKYKVRREDFETER